MSAIAHCNLGGVLGPQGQARFSDGSTWTAQALLKRALELDPLMPSAYCNLGVTLSGRFSEVRMEDASVWTKQALFIRSISLDPAMAPAYTNLGNCLRLQDKVQIDH